ncbi:esterase [Rhodanobacter sp. B04]|uniref:carboxylesterase family protein n=1 Tax=Rhodanobacter sp. B04 TaxID=1945860 RepID=UPI0009D637C3|nr:alpha/beta hydrolase [Rhodanobacter sp. B04]OOG62907.1 esterase [Rhodanobacter sp. B04]
MKRMLAALLVCLMVVGFSCRAADIEISRFIARQVRIDGHSYAYRVFLPAGWDRKRSWPVVLFLHGSGERGSDNRASLSQGLPPWLQEHGADFPAVVVIPQAPGDTLWHGTPEKMALAALQDSIAAYHGDRDRLYLTGLSMGGYGAWQIAADHPRMFAAAAIICGGVLALSDEPELHLYGVPADKSPYAWLAQRITPLPVWIFHGAADEVVPPQGSRDMYAALRAQGDDVRYTEFPGVNHGSWVPAYATPELWPWMFSRRRDHSR